MVRLAQTVHLSCTDTNTVPKCIETRFHKTHAPRSFIGCVQNDFWAYATFRATVHLSCIKIGTISKSDRIELPLVPRHLGVPSSASKTITTFMVRLAQTMHLSCTRTNIVSKQTEMRIYITHVTYEFNRLHSKWHPSLWYVWCIPLTYPTLGLAISPNRSNRASTWAPSPRSSIGCVQTDF
jgi:hypothetical protein